MPRRPDAASKRIDRHHTGDDVTQLQRQCVLPLEVAGRAVQHLRRHRALTEGIRIRTFRCASCWAECSGGSGWRAPDRSLTGTATNATRARGTRHRNRRVRPAGIRLRAAVAPQRGVLGAARCGSWASMRLMRVVRRANGRGIGPRSGVRRRLRRGSPRVPTSRRRSGRTRSVPRGGRCPRWWPGPEE
jgi:hypothetical protein